jgi:hypothetical protein
MSQIVLKYISSTLAKKKPKHQKTNISNREKKTNNNIYLPINREEEKKINFSN